LILNGKLVLEKKLFSEFFFFCYYLPLSKGIAFHLSKIEFPPLPTLKDDFVPNPVNIGSVVLEKIFK
jgi:hypothetical protein